MTSDKIRMGVIGANIHRGWAPRSHLPAIVASPEFELTAVCTTRQESAEESARQFGARLAFHIPFGHTVDAFRYVVGDFSHVAAVVSTQATECLHPGGGRVHIIAN